MVKVTQMVRAGVLALWGESGGAGISQPNSSLQILMRELRDSSQRCWVSDKVRGKKQFCKKGNMTGCKKNLFHRSETGKRTWRGHGTSTLRGVQISVGCRPVKPSVMLKLALLFWGVEPDGLEMPSRLFYLSSLFLQHLTAREIFWNTVNDGLEEWLVWWQERYLGQIPGHHIQRSICLSHLLVTTNMTLVSSTQPSLKD